MGDMLKFLRMSLLTMDKSNPVIVQDELRFKALLKGMILKKENKKDILLKEVKCQKLVDTLNNIGKLFSMAVDNEIESFKIIPQKGIELSVSTDCIDFSTWYDEEKTLNKAFKEIIWKNTYIKFSPITKRVFSDENGYVDCVLMTIRIPNIYKLKE